MLEESCLSDVVALSYEIWFPGGSRRRPAEIHHQYGVWKSGSRLPLSLVVFDHFPHQCFHNKSPYLSHPMNSILVSLYIFLWCVILHKPVYVEPYLAAFKPYVRTSDQSTVEWLNFGRIQHTKPPAMVQLLTHLRWQGSASCSTVTGDPVSLAEAKPCVDLALKYLHIWWTSFIWWWLGDGKLLTHVVTIPQLS